MGEMLVPYEPQVSCRNSHNARRHFTDFLRRGRVNPIHFGERPEERIPLFSKEEKTLEMLRLQARQARITQFAVVIALSLAMVVFLGLGVVVWRLNGSMDTIEAQLAPHAEEIVNSTVSMMNNIGGSMMDIHQITSMTKDLAKVNMGPDGAAGRAMNSTAQITERVAAFLRHPTLKLSLGEE